ncbi:unnamed protein product [Brassicogethes aeneus]|uniref:Major facilitator superfamily (MFS) profile domain-containing protein n=1 Tax=Brassicogethes aeneus TaxID=1431903 RepID=A0A9P0B322_BRAAE|nr:unnamed protein product [Brassicogethes aeneus]
MDEKPLDNLLIKLGKWGKFQLVYYLCLCLAVMYTVCQMSYIFTARDIKYRCFISECEKPSNTFNPDWLKDYVPFKNGLPNKCLYYERINETCFSPLANQNSTKTCNNFIYERSETTIVHDFNIHCDNNLWKLTIVGTINVIGELICLSYSGFISDRFGKSRVMTISMLMSSCIGMIKSFSTSYTFFISLEFLETAFCSVTYGAAFILAMEVVPSNQRNIGNIAISCIFTLGQILLGVVASVTPNWRILLRCMYLPGLLSVSFFWLIPESLMWLIHQGKHEEAKKIILKIARTNNTESNVDEESINNIIMKLNTNTDEADKEKETFLTAIQNKTLLLRTITCSYMWICCVFIYYGLTIHSVGITDNIYLSYIFTVSIEIPGFAVYYLIDDKIGRRKVMLVTLVLSGVFCFVDEYIPEEYFWCKLIGFLMGKCFITIAFAVLYVYTTEIFPTCARHSMFSLCSMFGRIGSILAPQVPLLARISKSLPLFIFAILAGTSGVLSLYLPETLNTKLPETVEEAVNIGKTKDLNFSSCNTVLLDQIKA